MFQGHVSIHLHWGESSGLRIGTSLAPRKFPQCKIHQVEDRVQVFVKSIQQHVANEWGIHY